MAPPKSYLFVSTGTNRGSCYHALPSPRSVSLKSCLGRRCNFASFEPSCCLIAGNFVRRIILALCGLCMSALHYAYLTWIPSPVIYEIGPSTLNIEPTSFSKPGSCAQSQARCNTAHIVITIRGDADISPRTGPLRCSGGDSAHTLEFNSLIVSFGVESRCGLCQ